MERAAKAEMVQDLNGVFSNANVVVVTHYSGLTVTDMNNLRVQMAEVDARIDYTQEEIVIHELLQGIE